MILTQPSWTCYDTGMINLPNERILIIGDSCMDRYTYCDVKRLSPEKPVPVLEVDHIEEDAGMAMNVYKNMCNMVLGRWCVDIVTNDD